MLILSHASPVLVAITVAAATVTVVIAVAVVVAVALPDGVPALFLCIRCCCANCAVDVVDRATVLVMIVVLAADFCGSCDCLSNCGNSVCMVVAMVVAPILLLMS